EEAEAFVGICTIDGMLERLDDALAACNKAVQVAPNYNPGYSTRGAVLFKRGDIGGALRDNAKAIQLSPERSAAYVNRGEVFRSLGKLDEALADLNKAIELTKAN